MEAGAMSWDVREGHVLDCLRVMPAESVQCVITSPPYWGLRSYKTEPQVWGGEPHEHEWNDQSRTVGTGGQTEKQTTNRGQTGQGYVAGGSQCPCGAWRGELGLEPTPELFCQHIVEVFREVRRVLHPSGTLWCNLGDSYAGSAQEWGHGKQYAGQKQSTNRGSLNQPLTESKIGFDRPPGYISSRQPNGLKPKDLVGIPWRVAFALQQPYETHCIKLERDRAWLAAFIDGEGCISIRRHDSNSNAEGNPRCQDGFIPFVCATNNDIALLEYAKLITGKGSVLLKQRAGSTDKRQIVSRHDSYGWRVESRASIEIVCDIYPFLIAKRKQAVLAYTLQQSNLNGKSLRGNGPLPHAEQEKRELLKQLINDCNQRKPVDIPSWCLEPKTQVEPGWWLRSAITLCKLNPMPESCRDRPTSATEMMFLLTKSATYFYDIEATREIRRTHEQRMDGIVRDRVYDYDSKQKQMGRTASGFNERGDANPTTGRNLRNWWPVVSEPFPLAHFATFGQKWIEPCIRAGTSERGCCAACGALWERTVSIPYDKDHPTYNEWRKQHQGGAKFPTGQRVPGDSRGYGSSVSQYYAKVWGGSTSPAVTTGWHPTCSHPGDPIPCTVLDIFCGSGTSGVVALKLGRSFVGLELQPDYVAMARKRIGAVMPLFQPA